MENLNEFPYFRVEFNKTGKAVDPEQVKALTDFPLGRGHHRSVCHLAWLEQ